MGHMDVVPVEPSTLARWIHPPFAGVIDDGFVWGRGSMDDKQALLSLTEAAEALIAQGFQPKRTTYFAFGDDEENDGHGAEALCALLKSRGVHPAFVLDCQYRLKIPHNIRLKIPPPGCDRQFTFPADRGEDETGW